MRQIFLFVTILCLLASCKKNSTEYPSHWTFKGVSHSGIAYTLPLDNSLSAIEANTADKTSVAFLSLPVKSGVYQVSSTHFDSTHCTVYASIGGNDPFFSPDQAATVSVSVANGKLTAVYNNISLKSISSPDTGTVSALIQE